MTAMIAMTAMNLLTTSLQPAETPGGAPRVTSFSATPDQDPMRNFGYTVSAYALIWVMLIGFWLLSWRRQRALEARLGEVERALDKAPGRVPASEALGHDVVLPSPAHFVFIPGILLVGLVFGYVLGARAVRAEMARRRIKQKELPPAVDFSLSEEQIALRDAARRFTRERIIPVAAECDRDSRFPLDVFRDAWEMGLVNPTAPVDCGGNGFGEFDHTLIVEELAYGCTGIQTSITGNSLALTPIKLAGTDEQKKKYIGQLTAEPILVSYATSEPDAGSDVAGLKTRFTRHGDDYVLNGQKCWITNCSYARWYVIFATSDPSLRHKGIAAFIVDRDAPGVRPGKKEDKLGQRASDTAVLHLDDVVVPKANLLGGEGQGFKLAMETFNQTRPDIAAGAAGLMRRCLDESVAYAKERKTFGVPIGQHQLVQAMIAEMAIKAEATRLLYQKAAWNLDHDVRDPMTSAYAKAFGADSAMQTAVDAVQVFGGNGYVKEYPVEKLMRDAKVLQIYEGTSQIQRIVIARGALAG